MYSTLGENPESGFLILSHEAAITLCIRAKDGALQLFNSVNNVPLL
jgi:hypothetical protein